MVHPSQVPRRSEREESKAALRRNSPWPFLFSFIYIALLIVPWVFTCLLNKGKFHLKNPKENYGYHNLTFRVQPEDITFNSRFVHATDILSYIAAVAALPVIFALLSRAAAVYAQRTSLTKPLSAKQLFGLADGRFSGTWLSFFGLALVALCEYMPPPYHGFRLSNTMTSAQKPSSNFPSGQSSCSQRPFV